MHFKARSNVIEPPDHSDSDVTEGSPYRENAKPSKEAQYELWVEIFFTNHKTHRTYVGTFPKSEMIENSDKELEKWLEILKTPQVIKIGKIAVCNTQHITHVVMCREKVSSTRRTPQNTPLPDFVPLASPFNGNW